MIILWYITLKGIIRDEIDQCHNIITQEFGMKLQSLPSKSKKIIKPVRKRKGK